LLERSPPKLSGAEEAELIRVPHPALSAMHAAYMLFCSRRRKVARAPRSEVVIGEGVGGPTRSPAGKLSTLIVWLRLSEAEHGDEPSELLS
jgi:hypothetical protein